MIEKKEEKFRNSIPNFDDVVLKPGESGRTIIHNNGKSRPDILKRFSISMSKIIEKDRRSSFNLTGSPPVERIPIRSKSRPEVEIVPLATSLTESMSNSMTDKTMSPKMYETTSPKMINSESSREREEEAFRNSISPSGSPKAPKMQGFSAELRKTLPGLFERMDKATKKYRKPKNEEIKECVQIEEMIEIPEYDKYREDRCPILSEPMQEHLFYIFFELGICFFFVLLAIGTISFTFSKISRDYASYLDLS